MVCFPQSALRQTATQQEIPAPAEKPYTEFSVKSADSRIVIQELLEGVEISLHALCDGATTKLFPTSQDHKRALDGDQGSNTGGMGAYSPAPFLDERQLAAVGRDVLDPWLKSCAAEGIDFRESSIQAKDGPKVLEFNARFGDPETQVYMTRLENDLVAKPCSSLPASTYSNPRVFMLSNVSGCSLPRCC